MLCQFNFKNFKSYRDETTIEMQAENTQNEMEETLIISPKDKRRFLPITAIYGPNGGGKSNALEALVCLINKVTLPIRAIIDKIKIDNIYAVPYRFCDENAPTKFEVYYRVDKDEFRYNLNFLEDKITYESLFVLKYPSKKPTKIFTRDNEDIDLGEELRAAKVRTNNNLEMPFLSFLIISYDIDIINIAKRFFLESTIINCDNDFENYFWQLAFREDLKPRIIDLFDKLDINIKDYRYVEDSLRNVMIYTKHVIHNHEYELNLNEESKGTQKLFSLLPIIIRSLMSGNITVIDEMDAKLHPKLIQYILEMYKNKQINTKGAQLIISSHDLTNMNNTIFRRDEILFAAQDIENVSEIYSLYEIRNINGEHIKSNSSYNKQYIEGKYGADPYLKKILSWEVN